jgi:hypothetical protein
MRSALAAVAVLSLIACAGAKPAGTDGPGKAKQPLASNASGPAPKGKYICTFEEDVGSHFRQKICRYIDDSNDARGRQQDDIREMGMHDVRNPSLGGGTTISGGAGH